MREGASLAALEQQSNEGWWWLLLLLLFKCEHSHLFSTLLHYYEYLVDCNMQQLPLPLHKLVVTVQNNWIPISYQLITPLNGPKYRVLSYVYTCVDEVLIQVIFMGKCWHNKSCSTTRHREGNNEHEGIQWGDAVVLSVRNTHVVLLRLATSIRIF
jgi:hypothetical protein